MNKLHSKYNPMKKKANNSMSSKKKQTSCKKNILNVILYTLLGLMVLAFIYYTLNNKNNNSSDNNTNISNKLNNSTDNNTNNKTNTTTNNDTFDINKVPSGDKLVEGFNTTDPNPTDPNPTDPNPTDPNPTDLEVVPFEQLPLDEQYEKCHAISQDIIGFRNKLSGATFRFQKVDKFDTSNSDYFLLGNIDNGMVIDVNNDTSLKYSIKDSSQDSQKFSQRSSGTNEYYFISKKFNDYALQYEHDHLSLRTHNNSIPYEGQKFIKLPENDKTLKDAISFGIGTPHLNKDDLNSKGPRTYVFLSPDGTTNVSSNVDQVLESGQALEQLTHEQLKEVVNNILRDYNQYKKVEQEREASMFGNKPFQLNLNLNKSNTESNNSFIEGFKNSDSSNHSNNKNNFELFMDLKNGNDDNKTSYDVRTLLNKYSPQEDINIGNFASSNINNNNLSGINNISKELLKAAAGTSFKGCPKIDKSNYVTGRQVARCYGCNPDSSLQ